MARVQPQQMVTNYKTRMAYGLIGIEGIPSCLTKHKDCKSYPKGCNKCSRIQGRYTNFVPKD